MRPALPLVLALAATVAGAAEPDGQDPVPAATPADQPFNPLRGLDGDGRIPKVALPADLPNPARWRYIPEGRIKPGGVVERLFVTTFIAPILYFEEAVGAGGGIALTDIDFRNQRRREFVGLFVARSTQGQERYAGVWQRWLDHREVPGGGVAVEERSLVRVRGGYERTLTRRFFGLGGATTADGETSYVDEVVDAGVQLQKALPSAGGDWVAQVGVRGDRHNLAGGHVPEVWATGSVYPLMVRQDDGAAALWLSAGLRWDGRDSQSNPYRGLSLGGTLECAPLISAGRAGGRAELKGVWALPLPGLFHDGGGSRLRATGVAEENPPTDALVIGAFARQAWGDLPFYELPSLGGRDTLRGYLADRFTDRAAWHAGAEWRLWVLPRGVTFSREVRIERIGLAPFADAGAVSPSWRKLAEPIPRWSLGCGLRLMFERAAVFRIDVAGSNESAGVNVAFGMPF
ncbi:MAG: outer membrane protein assembly factor [Planctomycetes bacterium]|jgi:hypothetical protein|nr:outer membrane protein assembly factor [Planctomycetota bacterium]